MKAQRKPRAMKSAVRQKIIEHYREGHTITTIAGLTGISRASIYHWLERGEQEEKGRYRVFYEAVEAAKAEHLAKTMRVVQRGLLGDDLIPGKVGSLQPKVIFAACLDILKRKLPPEEWGIIGPAIEVNVNNAPSYEQRIAEMKRIIELAQSVKDDVD